MESPTLNLSLPLENWFLWPSSLTRASHINFVSACPMYKELLRFVWGFEVLEQTQASHKLGKHPPLGFAHSRILTFSLELKQIALGEKMTFLESITFFIIKMYKTSMMPFTGLRIHSRMKSMPFECLRKLRLHVFNPNPGGD